MFCLTPKTKSVVLILAFFLYATAPLVEWRRLEKLLASGELPVNADSIGLGFLFFIVPWILFTPFVCGFFFWVWWKHPEPVSHFAFNRERPIWSLVWSIPFAFLFFENLFVAIENLHNFDFIEFSQGILLAYLMLLVRALIVFRK